MPFDFTDDSSSGLPTGCLIPEAMVQNNRLLWWTADGPSEQVLDVVIQDLIALQADRIEVPFGFEEPIYMCLSSANETTTDTCLSSCITGTYAPEAPH